VVIDRRIFKYFDWTLLISIFSICIAGLIVLYSAGYGDEASRSFSWLPLKTFSPSFLKQCIYWLGGSVVLIVAMSIPLNFFYKLSYPSYFVILFFLLAVLVVGTSSHGATRWFDFGLFKFQPSELMKLATILVMAHYLSVHSPHNGGYNLKQLFMPGALVFLPMALIMLEPDLGTALVVGAIGLGMLFFVGIKFWTLFVLGGVGLGALVIGWNFVLKDYQKGRVLTLFNPDGDPLGAGYHIIQSKIAVGSGEMFGKGMLQGTQSQLEFLPEHTTDFIFSVLAEEFGFIGCLVVLCMFFFILYRMLRIARESKELFSSLLVVGITIMIAFHVVVNVGMVIGILPVVGIPLPLFSYGGTALITNLFLIGVVFGVNIRHGRLTRGNEYR